MRRTALQRALVGVCVLAGLFLALPGAALAAECSKTWTGAVSGEWQVAENWLPEEVPTSSDVACIPSEKPRKWGAAAPTSSKCSKAKGR